MPRNHFTPATRLAELARGSNDEVKMMGIVTGVDPRMSGKRGGQTFCGRLPDSLAGPEHKGNTSGEPGEDSNPVTGTAELDTQSGNEPNCEAECDSSKGGGAFEGRFVFRGL